MFRFISVCFIIMVLFLGVGTLVCAQNCPNIGAPLSEGGAIWTSELQQISVCSPGDIQVPVPPNYLPGFDNKWKKATTTYYQEPDSCVFYAFRTVTEISENGTWPGPAPIPLENTWYTGIITDNGKKMSMQAQPTLYRPSYIVYGKITNVNKKTKMATEISFITHTSTGEAGISSTVEKCAYSAWGTSTRQ